MYLNHKVIFLRRVDSNQEPAIFYTIRHCDIVCHFVQLEPVTHMGVGGEGVSLLCRAKTWNVRSYIKN